MKELKKYIFVVLVFSLLLSACSVNNSGIDLNHSNDITVEDSLSADEAKELINNTFFDWSEEKIDYISAVELLYRYTKSEDVTISELAADYMEYIEIEHRGYQLLTEAQDLFISGEYAEAMKVAENVPDSYSQKKHADTIYNNSEEIILLLVSGPVSEEDYEAALSYLNVCLEIINNQSFISRINELNAEYEILKEVNKIIGTAVKQYESKAYDSAFLTLEQAIVFYPDNIKLKECLTGFRELFVVEVFNNVHTLCEQKKYKEANNVVNVAKEYYECEEFDLLIEAIKERANPIYRLGKEIARYFDSVSEKWESEELTVKKVAESTGNYVVKSGKKLFLGDYSEDNVTVLSFGANIVASLANLDLLFDLRDLSYDVTHWGEDEYFLVYLAADVVALIPVIGAIKYFGYFDKATEGVKDISKVVDDVAAASKTVNKAVDIIDEFASASKNIGKIDDVVDKATDVAKNSDVIAEAIDEIKSASPRFFETRNYRLKGSQHEYTGIWFEEKLVKYTHDDDLIGVFPKFDSKYEFKLSEDLWIKSDAVQFRECNLALYQEITDNKQLRSLFSEEEIALLKEGQSPVNWEWTWHHNEEEGLMQLVNADDHAKTGHTGGRFLWGGGTECRSGCEIPIEDY